METPASKHSFSNRPFPEKIATFDYDSQMKTVFPKNNIYKYLIKKGVLATQLKKSALTGSRYD